VTGDSSKAAATSWWPEGLTGMDEIRTSTHLARSLGGVGEDISPERNRATGKSSRDIVSRHQR
jgi:hypothetical protein